MMFIAFLVFAAAAMGAVLGDDQRANLDPRDYQNTTCTETDDNHPRGAKAQSVDEAINILNARTDKCYLTRGAESCKSLYCSYNSSVLWCNLDNAEVTQKCADLAPYLTAARKDCSHKYPNSDFTGVWGRATDSDGWFVQVQGDPWNCP